MAEAHLPEDIIVNILSWLPVKSLIRFSCVSKRLHFIIFSDPNFARSQFKAACEHKTLSRRRVVSTKAPQLESLDLQTPSFGETSSLRKLNIKDLNFYGVGYLSATDNYKVFLGSYEFTEEKQEVEMFSLRSHLWKRIQVPSDSSPFWLCQGTLLNEALHWVEESEDGILVFDLALEEFSKMGLPNFHPPVDFLINLGVSFEGCLCVCCRPRAACDSIEVWVMREYVRGGDSWTKLFNLKLSNPPEDLRHYSDLLVMETSIVAANGCDGSGLVRIDLKEDDKLEMYKTNGRWLNMITYEESLLRI